MTSRVEVEVNGRKLSCEVKDLSWFEKTSLAAEVPDKLKELPDDVDSLEDIEESDVDFEVDESVYEFLQNALLTATDFSKEQKTKLSTDEIVHLGSEVVNEVFAETDTEYEEKRVRCVQITKEMIEHIFTGKMSIVAGLPQDAELVDHSYDASKQMFELIFYHEDWEPVREGATIPTKQLQSVELPDDRREI